MSPKQHPGGIERAGALVGGAARVEHLRQILTKWYCASRRDLPWRRTLDPYAIWISEAMLQQTRVEAAIDHYARFLARFPTIQSLAAATEEQVVGMWSGLGYYNRARTLRRAAALIVSEHEGSFPKEVEVAKSLPGVGDYTVGAVLSIAYGLGVPLVDGNVARVFARLFAIQGEIERGPTKALLWDLAGLLIPCDHPDPRAREAPGIWNQALMELGALLCTPKSPKCDACALRAECKAHRMGLVTELPRKRPKPAPIDVQIEMLVARRANQVLLVRRPAGDRMGGMWEIPTRELPTHGSVATLLWPREPHGPGGLVEKRADSALGHLSHNITKHRIAASLHVARVCGEVSAQVDPKSAAWFDLDQLEGFALTGLTRKALKRLELGPA